MLLCPRGDIQTLYDIRSRSRSDDDASAFKGHSEIGNDDSRRPGRTADTGVMSACGPIRNMDRQKFFALFFAFLMVSSMVAWGVSLI